MYHTIISTRNKKEPLRRIRFYKGTCTPILNRIILSLRWVSTCDEQEKEKIKQKQAIKPLSISMRHKTLGNLP
jgi:hypothetical protein